MPRPKARRFRYPGRKPLDNRAALTGILFVLKTGLPWNDLPREMGCGSGAACWVRLHEWHGLGVWEALQAVLLAELRYADKIDWSRAAVDATTIWALRGGDKTGKTPADRGQKAAPKDHRLTDGGGTPSGRSCQTTGANRHESTQLQGAGGSRAARRRQAGFSQAVKPSVSLSIPGRFKRAFDSQCHLQRMAVGASG